MLTTVFVGGSHFVDVKNLFLSYIVYTLYVFICCSNLTAPFFNDNVCLVVYIINYRCRQLAGNFFEFLGCVIRYTDFC